MLSRIFDIIFSSTLLSILIVPIIFVSILICIDSSGPALFLQKRMGKGKKLFTLIKFRTMTNIDRTPSGEVFLDNPEITRIGKILRRYKIDELPQFINVLMGAMSVVGPRPCLLATYEKFKNNDAEYRFLVRPGITSNAGVSGSIFLSWDQKWAFDKEYALTTCFSQDIKIIAKTIVVVFLGEDRFLNK